jgi:hypothetical protein
MDRALLSRMGERMPSVDVVAVLWRRTQPCLDGLAAVRRGCPRHLEHSQWLLLSMPWEQGSVLPISGYESVPSRGLLKFFSGATAKLRGLLRLCSALLATFLASFTLLTVKAHLHSTF